MSRNWPLSFAGCWFSHEFGVTVMGLPESMSATTREQVASKPTPLTCSGSTLDSRRTSWHAAAMQDQTAGWPGEVGSVAVGSAAEKKCDLTDFDRCSAQRCRRRCRRARSWCCRSTLRRRPPGSRRVLRAPSPCRCECFEGGSVLRRRRLAGACTGTVGPAAAATATGRVRREEGDSHVNSDVVLGVCAHGYAVCRAVAGAEAEHSTSKGERKRGVQPAASFGGYPSRLAPIQELVCG